MADESDTAKKAGGGSLTGKERTWLDAVRNADTLDALTSIIDTVSEHDAYLKAKERWKILHRREIDGPKSTESTIPGTRVAVDGRPVFVHGVTHADTQKERCFLRKHITNYLDNGAAVYCEQGIRPMYFADMDDVCQVDDYRWAMHHCREQNIDSHIPGEINREFAADERLGADLRSVASEFRERTFTLIDAGKNMYGDRFTAALGDIASGFLTSHEELATGEDFVSFQLSQQAAANPSQLVELQQYYETVFLPQPLEREWLRRHDPELELFTHARNERIVAYVLYNAPEDTPVHIITGAAHQPGISYYLQAYRDGEWTIRPFETVP
ncbi:hypothetical protein ACFQJ7_13980 [Halovenus rubra]|uniref:Uncharacterized protein n=2 Tax=Halovenus rubra TaxID=869890 RepID=A0ACC7DYW8_9EURY|nr:hypothetical protein [Halovenus rubra]